MIDFKTLLAGIIIFFVAYLFMSGTLPEIYETFIFYIENVSLAELLLSNTAVIGIGLLVFLVAILFVGYLGEKNYW